MPRLVACTTAALVMLVAGAGSSLASPPPPDLESASNGYEFHIEQDSAWCGSNCLMDITMEAGNYTAQGPTTIDVEITDLASGPSVAVGDVYADNGDNFASTTAIGFQDGHKYKATMSWSTPAPPGGVPVAFTISWKFPFRDGAGPLTVPPWIAPQTFVESPKIKLGRASKKTRYRTISGRVLARVEAPNFTLTAKQPQIGRTAAIQRQVGSKWVTVAQLKTTRSGRFTKKVLAPIAPTHWRVAVAKSPASPAVTTAIPGKT